MDQEAANDEAAASQVNIDKILKQNKDDKD